MNQYDNSITILLRYLYIIAKALTLIRTYTTESDLMTETSYDINYTTIIREVYTYLTQLRCILTYT